MVYKNLNGIIDKVNALITYQNKQTTKLFENKFIDEFYYHSCICVQCLCTSYGQKKGRKSNWQFDSRPLKVKNRPDFLTCRWCAKYR